MFRVPNSKQQTATANSKGKSRKQKEHEHEQTANGDLFFFNATYLNANTKNKASSFSFI
jgi:hypothetical protein